MMASNGNNCSIRVVSVPNVDVGALPLRLPVADGINNGGFVLPGPRGQTAQAYSNIDLLVAGLEASLIRYEVRNLTKYFDLKRHGMFSENKVIIYYTVGDSGIVEAKTVTEIKHDLRILRGTNDYEELLRVLRRNAPLTFKWL
jgi:hypothetical protein